MSLSIYNLNVSHYRDINNPNIYWDPDDEQINYFLDFLPSYKFFSKPPDDVIRQYTDYTYRNYTRADGVVVNVTNHQRLCGVNNTQDFWTSTPSKCDTKYNKTSTTFPTYIASENNQTCLSIDSDLSSSLCVEGCESVCKVLNY